MFETFHLLRHMQKSIIMNFPFFLITLPRCLEVCMAKKKKKSNSSSKKTLLHITCHKQYLFYKPRITFEMRNISNMSQ
jgi:hypothetical protein